MMRFTGITQVRKHGLDVYQVVIRDVIAHEFLCLEIAQMKLISYRKKLGSLAA